MHCQSFSKFYPPTVLPQQSLSEFKAIAGIEQMFGGLQVSCYQDSSK